MYKTFKKIFSFFIISMMLSLSMTGCSDSSDDNGAPAEVTLQSIQVTPASKSAPVGVLTEYTATGYYSDNTVKDITQDVVWASDDNKTVGITSGDKAPGYGFTLNEGNTTITATLADVTSNSSKVTVTDAILESIQIDPVTNAVAVGIDVQYSATGIYSDRTHHDLTKVIDWISSDESIATITEEGLATSLKIGSTQIFTSLASINPIEINSATLNVTDATITRIDVTPSSATVPVGVTGHFTAYAYFTDGTNYDVTSQVVWSSADTTVVGFSADAGKATAIAVGNTTVKASLGTTSGTAAVEVVALELTSIVVTPAITTVVAGTELTYVATGHYNDGSTQNLTFDAGWASSDVQVADIPDKDGMTTTHKAGTVTITAGANDEATSTWITGTATLEVTAATVTSIAISPADASVTLGTTGKFSAIATLSDATTQDITADATWKSSDSSVVNVENGNNAGYAKALKVGSATVTASFKEITSNNATRTVTNATLVSIQLDPVTKTVAVGLEVEYLITGIYSDDTQQEIFATEIFSASSSNMNVATIAIPKTNILTATALSAGATTLSVIVDGITGTATLNVTAATATSIEITPPSATVPVGVTGHFTAYAYFTDGSSNDVTSQVTWSSADTTVVGFSADAGKATAIAVGNTTVKASLGTTSGTAEVEVVALELTSIVVTPTTTTVVAGTELTYVAMGHYNDGSTQDLTWDAGWTSSDTDVATISTKHAAATTYKAGTVTITAGANNEVSGTWITGSATLNVTASTVVSIEISPADASVAVGTTGDFNATATLSDATTQDITAFATWKSSDSSVVNVENGNNAGYVKALKVGNATVTASFKGVTSNVATREVVSAALLSIEIIPSATINLPNGLETSYRAIGHYENDIEADLLDASMWTVMSKTYAKPVGSVNGVFTVRGDAVGSTEILLEYDRQTHTDTVTLNVTDAVWQSSSLSPADKTVAFGDEVTYTLTEVYSDATEHLVNCSQWSAFSASEDFVSIQDCGRIISKGVGTAMISVTYKKGTFTASLTGE